MCSNSPFIITWHLFLPLTAFYLSFTSSTTFIWLQQRSCLGSVTCNMLWFQTQPCCNSPCLQCSFCRGPTSNLRQAERGLHSSAASAAPCSWLPGPCSLCASASVPWDMSLHAAQLWDGSVSRPSRFSWLQTGWGYCAHYCFHKKQQWNHLMWCPFLSALLVLNCCQQYSWNGSLCHLISNLPCSNFFTMDLALL